MSDSVNPGPEVVKLFILNSAGHEIFSANKYENANKVGIFIFISREIFRLSYVKQEKIAVVNKLDLFAGHISCSAVLSMKKVL